MFVPFGVNSYTSKALTLSAQRVVNARTVKSTAQTRSQTPVFRCPGIRTFLEPGNTIRGAAIVDGTLVILAGTTVYSVSPIGITTTLGTIPGIDQTATASGVGEAVFLADGDAYVVDSISVTQVTDPDYLPSTQVVWSDGYFLFLAEDRVQASALNDPFVIDALAYDSLTWATEQPIAIITSGRDLIHFMPEAIAIGYNKGTSPYPFALAPDGFVELGCAASRSPAKLDNTVFWFANDRTVRSLRGTTPVRISNEPLEQLFAEFETIDDAFGMAITDSGCFSYILSFPAEGRTFEYNIATELWNERQTYGQNHWDVRGYIKAYGKHFLWREDTLGVLDPTCYTEFGNPQVVTLTSAPIFDGVNWVHFDRCELDLDPGNGIAVGQGSDPLVVLRYSDDGGNTWSADFHRSVGKLGQKRQRTIFTRHGRSRNRVYQLAYSEPTFFAFYGAYLNEDEAMAA